jgi:hypothetical protein
MAESAVSSIEFSRDLEAILKAGYHDPDPKATRIEKPAEWAEHKIAKRASRLGSDRGPEGEFDD